MRTLTPTEFETIVNVLHDGFFVVDALGKIEMVNAALLKLTGYQEHELIGKTCSIFECDACKQLREHNSPYWCILFQEQETHHKRCYIRKKDGELLEILKSARVLVDANGGVVSAVEVVTDMTTLRQKEAKIKELARLVEHEHNFSSMIGSSAAMRSVFSLLQRAAESEAPVLIIGESGTGKELAAKAIHELGKRKNKNYIKFNCSTVNEHLLESELFGHTKGAFTGAIKDRIGLFEAATGGDLFLDEIGDMPLPLQAKILRVLETNTLIRVGENQERAIDVRYIAATNRPLEIMVQKGIFREDLFFRLNVIPIHLPPLRERKEDIPSLVRFFLHSIAKRDNVTIKSVSPSTMNILLQYNWPGNVRELRSAIEYACVVTTGNTIEPEALPNATKKQLSALPPMQSLAQACQQIPECSAQQQEIIAALDQAKGNITQAAKILGIYRGTLRNRMARLGITVQKQW